MGEIAGQLNEVERKLIQEAILNSPKKPETAVEVGTWLGGGSTLHILGALERNGTGHLWGIEADRSIYEQMLGNLRAAAPEICHRFTPLFGYSQDVLRKWTRERGPGATVDFAFLDGGNNPREQMDEFGLLDSLIPVGGQLMSHDAKARKGRWLVPYISRLDNWESRLYDVSYEGLFYAKKIAAKPSAATLRAANSSLFRMKCNPVEIAATWLPSSFCGFCLKLLPKGYSRWISDGRK